MGSVSEIIDGMRAVAPPGQPSLDDAILRQLRDLTRALMRSAAMAKRHSDSLGADHRRILQAIEDHANPSTRLRRARA